MVKILNCFPPCIVYASKKKKPCNYRINIFKTYSRILIFMLFNHTGLEDIWKFLGFLWWDVLDSLLMNSCEPLLQHVLPLEERNPWVSSCYKK